MPEVDVRSRQMQMLAKRLREAGNGKELRKELLRGIWNSNRTTIAKIRPHAKATLPARGGLADLVANSRIATRSRLSGANASVQIQGTGRMRLSDLNSGRLRHPVFGNRSNWVEQQVPEGWFDDPIRSDLPQIRSSIQRVMDDVARKITR